MKVIYKTTNEFGYADYFDTLQSAKDEMNFYREEYGGECRVYRQVYSEDETDEPEEELVDFITDETI